MFCDHIVSLQVSWAKVRRWTRRDCKLFWCRPRLCVLTKLCVLCKESSVVLRRLLAAAFGVPPAARAEARLQQSMVVSWLQVETVRRNEAIAAGHEVLSDGTVLPKPKPK